MATEVKTEVKAEVEMEEDKGFDKTSDYTWVNIEVNDIRIGKVRVCVSGKRLTINSITIFPEFERNGYARKVIHSFREHYEEIIADRVRNTAKGFWEKMGFDSDNNGNYVWKSGEQ